MPEYRKLLLIPNGSQQKKLFQYANIARYSYNWALRKELLSREEEKRDFELYELKNQFLSLRRAKGYEWLRLVPVELSMNAIEEAFYVYKQFRMGKTGCPKFKKRGRSKLRFFLKSAGIECNGIWMEGEAKEEQQETGLEGEKQEKEQENELEGEKQEKEQENELEGENQEKEQEENELEGEKPEKEQEGKQQEKEFEEEKQEEEQEEELKEEQDGSRIHFECAKWMPQKAYCRNVRISYEDGNWYAQVLVFESEEDYINSVKERRKSEKHKATFMEAEDKNQEETVPERKKYFDFREQKRKKLEKRRKRMLRSIQRKYEKNKKGENNQKTRNMIKKESQLERLNQRIASLL